MGGQITRNSFYGETARARLCTIDQSWGRDRVRSGAAVASVRVKGVGVLATPDALPSNVDKFFTCFSESRLTSQ